MQIYGASAFEVLYNGRVKRYPDGSYDLLISEQPIFNPDGWELADVSRAKLRIAGQVDDEPKIDTTPVSSDRALRRAKGKLKDFILCNDFSYFITLTLDKDKISRTDYGQVVRKLNTFLSNAVQRRGLQYILVPEYHKDGQAIHFHGLINSALPMVDSGTVSVAGRKKPVKLSTYDRYYKGQPYTKVYNIPSWGVGFSTAIPVYGERLRLARYVGKYMEKDLTKIGGRYYLHSNNLNSPDMEYFTIDFEHFEAEPFSFDGVNNQWKFKHYPARPQDIVSE